MQRNLMKWTAVRKEMVNRLFGRTTKDRPTQRFYLIANSNRVVKPKDWKDVEEMTVTVEKKKWLKAVDDEMKSSVQNNTGK